MLARFNGFPEHLNDISMQRVKRKSLFALGTSTHFILGSSTSKNTFPITNCSWRQLAQSSMFVAMDSLTPLYQASVCRIFLKAVHINCVGISERWWNWTLCWRSKNGLICSALAPTCIRVVSVLSVHSTADGINMFSNCKTKLFFTLISAHDRPKTIVNFACWFRVMIQCCTIVLWMFV